MLPPIPTVRKLVRLSIEYNPDKLPDPSQWDWSLLLAQSSVIGINVLPPEGPSAADVVNPELTPQELSALLFSEGSPISPERFDHPIDRVLVVSYDLGLRLSAQDPHKKVFHIEFFPGLTPPRAEVWSQRAWQESLTRAYRIGRARREADPVAQMYDQFNSLCSELQVHLKRTAPSIKFGELRHFAEMMVRTPELDSIFEILQITPDQITRIKKVRELYQAAANSESNGPATNSNTDPAA